MVEVTSRTLHERLLLRPSAEVNEIVKGIIGRAQSKFPVLIHAFVVLSNHWHALLSVDDAAQLAGFMGFVNGNIARELGRLHDWRQRFWGQRYRSIIVVDDDAAVARFRYILRNGCKEGLVDRPEEWPGVSCVEALTGGAKLSGTWHDRTAESLARRRGQPADPARFTTTYEIELSSLPCWASLSAEEHQQACAALIADIETETRRERADSQRECVGREAVLSMHPHNRPVDAKRSPAPAVHASCSQARWTFRRAYAAFADAFRSAAAELREHGRAEFPAGAFPPRLSFVPALAVAA